MLKIGWIAIMYFEKCVVRNNTSFSGQCTCVFLCRVSWSQAFFHICRNLTAFPQILDSQLLCSLAFTSKNLSSLTPQKEFAPLLTCHCPVYNMKDVKIFLPPKWDAEKHHTKVILLLWIFFWWELHWDVNCRTYFCGLFCVPSSVNYSKTVCSSWKDNVFRRGRY